MIQLDSIEIRFEIGFLVRRKLQLKIMKGAAGELWQNFNFLHFLKICFWPRLTKCTENHVADVARMEVSTSP